MSLFIKSFIVASSIIIGIIVVHYAGAVPSQTDSSTNNKENNKETTTLSNFLKTLSLTNKEYLEATPLRVKTLYKPQKNDPPNTSALFIIRRQYITALRLIRTHETRMSMDDRTSATLQKKMISVVDHSTDLQVRLESLFAIAYLIRPSDLYIQKQLLSIIERNSTQQTVQLYALSAIGNSRSSYSVIHRQVWNYTSPLRSDIEVALKATSTLGKMINVAADTKNNLKEAINNKDLPERQRLESAIALLSLEYPRVSFILGIKSTSTVKRQLIQLIKSSQYPVQLRADALSILFNFWEISGNVKTVMDIVSKSEEPEIQKVVQELHLALEIKTRLNQKMKQIQKTFLKGLRFLKKTSNTCMKIW